MSGAPLAGRARQSVPARVVTKPFDMVALLKVLRGVSGA
jgi:hypothetical protein